jgi:Ring finger domain
MRAARVSISQNKRAQGQSVASRRVLRSRTQAQVRQHQARTEELQQQKDTARRVSAMRKNNIAKQQTESCTIPRSMFSAPNKFDSTLPTVNPLASRRQPSAAVDENVAPEQNQNAFSRPKKLGLHGASRKPVQQQPQRQRQATRRGRTMRTNLSRISVEEADGNDDDDDEDDGVGCYDQTQKQAQTTVSNNSSQSQASSQSASEPSKPKLTYMQRKLARLQQEAIDSIGSNELMGNASTHKSHIQRVKHEFETNTEAKAAMQTVAQKRSSANLQSSNIFGGNDSSGTGGLGDVLKPRKSRLERNLEKSRQMSGVAPRASAAPAPKLSAPWAMPTANQLAGAADMKGARPGAVPVPVLPRTHVVAAAAFKRTAIVGTQASAINVKNHKAIGGDGFMAQTNPNALPFHRLNKMRLVRISNVDASHADSMCELCNMHYKDQDIGRVLPCGHVFHNECIMDIFSCDVLCPVCEYDCKLMQHAD